MIEVGIKDMCRALDLSQQQVNSLENHGVVVKISRGKYDVIESSHNYIRRIKGREGKTSGNADGDQPDYYQERARLTKAQADRQEIEVQKAQGVLVEADKVVKAWVDTIVTTRNRLLAIPQKLSYEISVTDDREEIEKLLVSEMRSALTAMENLEGHSYSEDGEADEVEEPKEEPKPKKKRGRPKKNA